MQRLLPQDGKQASNAPSNPSSAVQRRKTSKVSETMHQAWVKAVLLQVILWSQPYVRDGDFKIQAPTAR